VRDRGGVGGRRGRVEGQTEEPFFRGSDGGDEIEETAVGPRADGRAAITEVEPRVADVLADDVAGRRQPVATAARDHRVRGRVHARVEARRVVAPPAALQGELDGPSADHGPAEVTVAEVGGERRPARARDGESCEGDRESGPASAAHEGSPSSTTTRTRDRRARAA